MKAETKYFSYMIFIFHEYFFWLLHIQLFSLFIFVSYFPFSFLLSCFPYNLVLYKAIQWPPSYLISRISSLWETGTGLSMLTVEEVAGGEHRYSCETVFNTEQKITGNFESVEGPLLSQFTDRNGSWVLTHLAVQRIQDKMWERYTKELDFSTEYYSAP